MKYLMNCKTLEELKKAYRAFTKKLHPDCGGTKEEMQQLNDEYEKMFKKYDLSFYEIMTFIAFKYPQLFLRSISMPNNHTRKACITWSR